MELTALKTLISNKEELDTLDSKGLSLLHHTILQDHLDGTQMLLDGGASVHQPDALGFSPLDLARYLNRPQHCALLGDTFSRSLLIELKGASQPSLLNSQQLEESLGIQLLPYMHFPNYSTLKSVHEFCSYTHEQGYIGVERSWLGMTYKKEIEEGSPLHGVVRWIDHTLGYGVFAQRDIQPWELIGMYTGTVKKRPFFASSHQAYSFRYPIGELYPRKFIIESEKGGNLTRFLNHSDDPNLTASSCFAKGMVHMLLYAHRTIRQGEQLCFDYGEHYWKGKEYQPLP